MQKRKLRLGVVERATQESGGIPNILADATKPHISSAGGLFPSFLFHTHVAGSGEPLLSVGCSTVQPLAKQAPGVARKRDRYWKKALWTLKREAAVGNRDRLWGRGGEKEGREGERAGERRP